MSVMSRFRGIEALSCSVGCIWDRCVCASGFVNFQSLCLSSDGEADHVKTLQGKQLSAKPGCGLYELSDRCSKKVKSSRDSIELVNVPGFKSRRRIIICYITIEARGCFVCFCVLATDLLYNEARVYTRCKLTTQRPMFNHSPKSPMCM